MKLAALLSALFLAGMVVGSPTDREGIEKHEHKGLNTGARSEGCLEPADCPGMEQYCDLEDGQCKFGCDEDEDCPEGKFCIYVNHMCQC